VDLLPAASVPGTKGNVGGHTPYKGDVMCECKSRANLVVVLVALLAIAASASAEPPRLDLVWVDPTDMVAGTFSSVAAEARMLLAPTGADVTWTDAPRGAVVGPESLVVIAVPTYPTSLGRERHVMGSTKTVTEGGRAVWVFPDQVAWALGLDLKVRHSWGKRAEINFGRALARVAAHEVIHALGASTHSRSGLMAAHLDRNALTASVLGIVRATVATVRMTLSGGTRSAAGSWTPALRRGAPFTAAADLLAVPGSSH
jgi:hypothetical protein